MHKQRTTKSNWIQTILLVVGIVIAIMLSVRTFIATPESPIKPTSVEQPEDQGKNKELSTKEESAGGGVNLHSSARLFQLFTENLPYLNSK